LGFKTISIMNNSRRRFLVRAVAIGAVLVMAGCGQKGPLYLPTEDDKEKPKTASGDRKSTGQTSA
jgi:predicted small lipoprotein YifL